MNLDTSKYIRAAKACETALAELEGESEEFIALVNELKRCIPALYLKHEAQ